MNLPEGFEHDTIPPATCNLQLATGSLPCDAYHHFYHYQSSAQYLWLARTLMALGLSEEAKTAYTKSIFQDHFNEEAIAGKNGDTATRKPLYDKHPACDLEFLGLIGQLPDDATRPHDEGMAALAQGDLAKALTHFEDAIAISPAHSNSFFARGQCYFLRREYEKARTDFTEAIRLSHIRHDAYHRSASAEHVERGREFLKAGNLDLAVNDFTKALDLHRGNKDALAERAKTYRMKGSDKLAEEDEAKLKS